MHSCTLPTHYSQSPARPPLRVVAGMQCWASIAVLAFLASVDAFAPSVCKLNLATRSGTKQELPRLTRAYSFAPRPGDDKKITREKDEDAEFFESEVAIYGSLLLQVCAETLTSSPSFSPTSSPTPSIQFDRTPLKDRLPVALGFLGAVSIPFIIGLIYLYTNK